MPITNQIRAYDMGLADEFGVIEASLIFHFQYWVQFNRKMNRHFKEGRTWSYQTRKEICAHFPCFTFEQIKYACENLVKHGVLITKNFNKNPIDKTLWYAFENEEYYCPPHEENSKNVYEREISPSKGKIPHREGNFPHQYQNINTNYKTHMCIEKKINKEKKGAPIGTPDVAPSGAPVFSSFSNKFSVKQQESSRQNQNVALERLNLALAQHNVNCQTSQNPGVKVLTEFLYDKLRTKNPSHKPPNWLRWYQDIDKLLNVDKRSEADVRKVIEWAFNQQDDFWPTAIQSPKSLRKLFDRAIIKINHLNNKIKHNNPVNHCNNEPKVACPPIVSNVQQNKLEYERFKKEHKEYVGYFLEEKCGLSVPSLMLDCGTCKIQWLIDIASSPEVFRQTLDSTLEKLKQPKNNLIEKFRYKHIS